jgi:hypothetical protein
VDGPEDPPGQRAGRVLAAERLLSGVASRFAESGGGREAGCGNPLRASTPKRANQRGSVSAAAALGVDHAVVSAVTARDGRIGLSPTYAAQIRVVHFEQ